MRNVVAGTNRLLGIAFVACLSVCVPAGAADLVGTWMSLLRMLIFIPGQQISGYPNPTPLPKGLYLRRENGALVGAFLSMTGKKPLSDLKVQGQTVSFSQGKNKFHGEIRGNELRLLVELGRGVQVEPYTCRKATAEDLKIIEAGPSYSFRSFRCLRFTMFRVTMLRQPRPWASAISP